MDPRLKLSLRVFDLPAIQPMKKQGVAVETATYTEIWWGARDAPQVRPGCEKAHKSALWSRYGSRRSDRDPAGGIRGNFNLSELKGRPCKEKSLRSEDLSYIGREKGNGKGAGRMPAVHERGERQRQRRRQDAGVTLTC